MQNRLFGVGEWELHAGKGQEVLEYMWSHLLISPSVPTFLPPQPTVAQFLLCEAALGTSSLWRWRPSFQGLPQLPANSHIPATERQPGGHCHLRVEGVLLASSASFSSGSTHVLGSRKTTTNRETHTPVDPCGSRQWPGGRKGGRERERG